jgi:hypothetical protein
MSQNPYAANLDNPLAEPPRTSILAISSLVTSLICCIPGLSVIGTLLGVVAMFRISSSNGRRRGTGLALAGIILGILVSLAWVMMAIGAVSAAKEFSRSMGQMVNVLKAPTADELRNGLAPALGAKVTDEKWNAFKAEIEAEIGTFKPIPDNVMGLLQAYGQVGQPMQNFKEQNAMPVPLLGTKGNALLVLQFTPGGTPAAPDDNLLQIFLKQARGLYVELPSGKKVVLFDDSK